MMIKWNVPGNLGFLVDHVKKLRCRRSYNCKKETIENYE